eukprot:gene19906-26609_t
MIGYEEELMRRENMYQTSMLGDKGPSHVFHIDQILWYCGVLGISAAFFPVLAFMSDKLLRALGTLHCLLFPLYSLLCYGICLFIIMAAESLLCFGMCLFVIMAAERYSSNTAPLIALLGAMLAVAAYAVFVSHSSPLIGLFACACQFFTLTHAFMPVALTWTRGKHNRRTFIVSCSSGMLTAGHIIVRSTLLVTLDPDTPEVQHWHHPLRPFLPGVACFGNLFFFVHGLIWSSRLYNGYSRKQTFPLNRALAACLVGYLYLNCLYITIVITMIGIGVQLGDDMFRNTGTAFLILWLSVKASTPAASTSGPEFPGKSTASFVAMAGLVPVGDIHGMKRKMDGGAQDGGSKQPRSLQDIVSSLASTPVPVVDLNGNITDSFPCPADKVGKVIGKQGATVKDMMVRSGTTMRVDLTAQGDTKPVVITGTREAVERAKAMVKEVLEAEAISTAGPGDLVKKLEVPTALVGRIIGRGGETIKNLQSASETRIVVSAKVVGSTDQGVEITGKADMVERAEKMHLNLLQLLQVLQIQELISSDQPITSSAGIAMVIEKHCSGFSRSLECPKPLVGRIIGRGGETIKGLQRHFNIKLQIDQATEPAKLVLTGTAGGVSAAERAVKDILAGGDVPNFNAPPPGAGGGFDPRGYPPPGGPGNFPPPAYAPYPGGGPGGPPGRGGPGAPPGHYNQPPPTVYTSYGGHMGGYTDPMAPPTYPAYTPPPSGYQPPAQAPAPYRAPVPSQYTPPTSAPSYPSYGGPSGGSGAVGGGNAPAPSYSGPPAAQNPAPGGYGAPAQQPSGGYSGAPAMQNPQGGGGYNQPPAQQQQHSGYGAAPPPAPAPAAPSPWSELRDDKGQVYYFNSATGTSQWAKPADM